MNLKSLFSITFVTFGCSSFAKAVVLAVDFKDSDVPIPAQAGFSPFVLSGGASQVIGDYTVTIDATAGSAVPTTGSITGFDGTSSDFDDRLRSTPLNSGFLTTSDLYRDFIFSPDSNNGGLNVTIDGLEPNTEYLFEIWSYDPVSVGGTIGGVPNFRVSDWFAGGFQVIENYSFRGENAPTNDLASFTFTATADIDGLLVISGRRDQLSTNSVSPQPGVFLNGLRVSSIPEPSSAILLLTAITPLVLRRRR
jgi:hypothetical protein